MNKLYIGNVATKEGYEELAQNILIGPTNWFGELNVGDYVMVSGMDTIIDKIMKVESIEDYYKEDGSSWKKYNFSTTKAFSGIRSNLVLSSNIFNVDMTILNKAQNPSPNTRFFELTFDRDIYSGDINSINFENTIRHFCICLNNKNIDFNIGDIIIYVSNRESGYMIERVCKYLNETTIKDINLFLLSPSITIQNYGFLKAVKQMEEKGYKKKFNLLSSIISSLDSKGYYKHPLDSNISEFYQNALCINNESKKNSQIVMKEQVESEEKNKEDIIIGFKDFCAKHGYYYEEDLIRRFVMSLETKRFLLITGISGTGKTKIAELWVKYLNCGKDRSIRISVGSNWNDNKKLLGFKNILFSDDNYEKTNLVNLLERANSNKKEYIVILDEMNLSYVERYFADFLSALESFDNVIDLPDGTTVKWSDNVKVIGTVNVDETTYMFSPKVLDRANVIEMNGVKPSKYIDSVINSKEIYSSIKDNPWFEEYKEMLDALYDATNKGFAYRTVDEMTKYISKNMALFAESEADWKKYMDEQIFQKVLPKLHGNRSEMEPILNKIMDCIYDSAEYPLSSEKINTMKQNSMKGYISFIGD